MSISVYDAQNAPLMDDGTGRVRLLPKDGRISKFVHVAATRDLQMRVYKLEANMPKEGQPGAPGVSAYEIAVVNGFEGTEEEWLESLKGEPGPQGERGQDGLNGTAGLSAYEIAVGQGYSGTQTQWIASLRGSDGLPGAKGEKGETGAAGAVGAVGPAGPKGDKGDTGLAGTPGAQGPAGPTPTLTVGSVTTGAVGAAASATITGTAPNFVLNLVLPVRNPTVTQHVGYAAGQVNTFLISGTQTMTLNLDTTMPDTTYTVKARFSQGINVLTNITYTVLSRTTGSVTIRVSVTGALSSGARVEVDAYDIVVS